jgi:hypothetical protein
MDLDWLGLVTVLGGVATALFNLLHGRDDGKMVSDLTKSIDDARDATSQVTSQLSSAFSETQKQLGRLIDVLSELAKRDSGP